MKHIFTASVSMKDSGASVQRRKAFRNHICRFEEMESREFLSATAYEAPAPINVGIVYHEDYYTGFQSGKEDADGDTFVIAWNGGAENTTLEKIIIDLNKTPGAGSDARISFNSDGMLRPNGYGTFHPFDDKLESNLGNGITASAEVSQDGKQLVINFTGFTAGKKFYFKIDVDEYHAGEGMGVDRHVSGKEMEGAMVTSYFSAEDYKNTSHRGMMLDQYRINQDTGLDQLLPPDEYYGTGQSDTVNTAGAWGTLEVQHPKPGSISGYVYEDNNNDGLFARGNGEKAIQNVFLDLHYKTENGTYEWVARTQTNADGYYEFTNIPGGRTYLVTEIQPDNYADGKDTPGTSGGVSWEPDRLSEIHLGANEHGENYNFGELKYASLTGFVYHDRNADGIRSSGEEGIAGTLVKLQILSGNTYQDVAGQVTRTDADGKYRFDNLIPFQTYKVVEVEQPTGFADGKESVGWVGTADNRVGKLPAADNDTIEGVYLGSGEFGQEYNFGEYKKGSIGGYVYEDNNNDGNKDSDEHGIGGVEIWLCVLNEKGEKENLRKTVTGTDGSYFFGDLEPGKTYCVTEFDPEGYCDGKDTVGTIDGTERGSINLEISEGKDQIHDITIGSGENGINYNFAENRRGKISGFVYVDANENGQRDTNGSLRESGIGNVLLTLWVWDEGQGKYIQTAKTATTDSDGYYEFTGLCPFKKYQVRETQPVSYDDGRETIGTLGGENSVNDIIGNIGMPPNGSGENYNFGELLKKGSVSGYVYVDANENGVKDSGETGIADATLTLQKLVAGEYVNTGRTVKTGGNGYYIFDNLDPNETYRVVETQPGNYDDGQETVGSLGGDKSENDVIQGIFVAPNQHGTDYNFGELLKKGSVSGYVYVDTNENGVKDSGETGIAGVTLTLQKLVAGEYVNTGRTVKTGSNGYYIFDNLDPNETYQVIETQPDHYDDGQETVGSLGGDKSENDVIQGIFVAPNQHGTDYNFGELVPPPAPEKGSISGYVYVDADENGVKDDGEQGIKNAVVTLWKLVNGEYVNTGRFVKTDAAGFYSFEVDPNETYKVAEQQPAAYLDGLETVGSLGGIQTENDEIKDIAVGEGKHGTDYNFGEWVRPGTPPPPPPPPVMTPPRMTGAMGQPSGAAVPNWNAPYIGESLQAGYGGGGLPSGYSWHLSVVNAGYPRDADAGIADNSSARKSQQTVQYGDAVANTDAARYVSVAWSPMPMNQSVWYVRDKNGRVTKRATFGPDGGIPLVGDFNGDGIADLAVFHNGNWYIDVNGNGQWDEEDLWCEMGNSSDQPIAGDWDGDGKTDIGIFGPQWAGDAEIIAKEPGLPSVLNTTQTSRLKNMPPSDIDVNTEKNRSRAMKHTTEGLVRYDVIDHVFQYGSEGDRSFSGDFSGDKISKIGVYRNGQWIIDYNGNGKWDAEDAKATEKANSAKNRAVSVTGDGIPVIGDWNGSGIEKIGLYVNGVWHLDTDGDFEFDTEIEFGEPGDFPVAGDFAGDGTTQLAVFRAGKADSLIAARTPSSSPAVSSITTNEGPKLASASPAPQVAGQYAGADNDDASNGQGTLPEQMQRHGRTKPTDHTNTPLHRHRHR